MDMAYRAFKPCGCVGLVTVDVPEMQEENAKMLAAAILDGWHVERVTVQEVREGHFRKCKQHKESVQPTLPLEEKTERSES